MWFSVACQIFTNISEKTGASVVGAETLINFLRDNTSQTKSSVTTTRTKYDEEFVICYDRRFLYVVTFRFIV